MGMSVRRVRRQPIVLGLIAALALAGCGGEDRPERAGTVEESSGGASESSQTSESSNSSEVEIDAAGRKLDDKEAEAALPDVSSLPTGWSVDTETSDDTDDESEGKVEPAKCEALLDGVSESWDEEPIGEAEKSYEAGQMGPFMEVGISSYDEEYPDDAFGKFLKAFESCPEFTSVEDGESTTFKVSSMSFPNLGEETAALRMAAESEGFPIQVDLVVIRAGHNVISLAHSSLGGDSDSSSVMEETATKVVQALENG